MRIFLVLLLITILLSSTSHSQAQVLQFDPHALQSTEKSADTAKIAKVSLPFIENQGQTDSKVKFYANTFAGTIFVTDDDLTYSITNGNSLNNTQKQVIKERFLYSSLHPAGLDKSDSLVNYFVGEKSDWRSDVTTFNTISLGEIWPSIDVTLKAYGKNMEKIFTLNPGGKTSDIKLGFDGVTSLYVDENGMMFLKTELGSISMTKPIAYQQINGQIHDVKVSYWVDGTMYGFDVGMYDDRYDLIIDPLLGSTFVGGSDTDYADAIAIDSSGNVYVTGRVLSTNYPTTGGAYDTTYNGSRDVFVSKLNNGLTALSSSTFIGGSISDSATAIAIDGLGNVYVTGNTQSTDYPTTGGAYDTTHNGFDDVFVSKLNNGLTALSSSTFIGGASYDYADAIAIDGFGNVYVTGYTDSTNYPSTVGAYDTSLNGMEDAFVTSLSGGRCSPQLSDDWTISSSCTLETSATITGNVIVQNGAVLTIPNGVSLDIDFATKHLLVKPGGGVLIQAGGIIS